MQERIEEWGVGELGVSCGNSQATMAAQQQLDVFVRVCVRERACWWWALCARMCGSLPGCAIWLLDRAPHINVGG